MRSRLRGRFALGFALAIAAVLVAAVLWVGEIAASRSCPGSAGLSQTGLDQPYSAWPPGAECVVPPRHGGAQSEARQRRLQSHTYIRQAAPELKYAILGLAGFAAISLLAGIAAGVRYRRRRQPEPPPVPGVP